MHDRRGDRYLAWGVTWVAYASYYAGRKAFSVSKKSIRDQLAVSEVTLGAIDTAFLAAYALGQFISGFFGDRIGARRLIAVGMLVSAGACAGFGMASHALLFGILFCINGVAQATGWPGTTRAMAEWTTASDRGTVMAFWSTCYQVGGIVATAVAGFLLVRLGWRSAFFSAALWMTLVALGVLLLLKPGHRNVEAQPAIPGSSLAAKVLVPDDPHQERRLAQARVLKDPVLWSFGASYFFIKFIRYALLFWLHYYLSNTLGFAQDRAAYVSTAFEAGGALGVIVIGTYSDRARHLSRPLLCALSLVGLALALWACTWLTEPSVIKTTLLLALVGALLFGPDSLLCGAAAQDAGGRHAISMATGFVNGLGSIGGLVEGVTLPLISVNLGWSAMFPSLSLLSLGAALALVPAIRRVSVVR